MGGPALWFARWRTISSSVGQEGGSARRGLLRAPGRSDEARPVRDLLSTRYPLASGGSEWHPAGVPESQP
jgi:hypothetical protein